MNKKPKLKIYYPHFTLPNDYGFVYMTDDGYLDVKFGDTNDLPDVIICYYI